MSPPLKMVFHVNLVTQSWNSPIHQWVLFPPPF
uniref:Uncharacterized protein n=1 Tax=Rhizophora mucronata TaxID=61149 RepID=A0A2P2QHL5_RHIMU